MFTLKINIIPTAIYWAVIKVVTAFDAGAVARRFNELNVMVVTSKALRNRPRRIDIFLTHPVHLLPWGLPFPPSPPLESYCPPPSLGFKRSTVSGRIQPVTSSFRWLVLLVCQPDNGLLWRTLCETTPTRRRPAYEVDVAPKVSSQQSLVWRGLSSWRTIRFHPSWVLAVSNVGVGFSICLFYQNLADVRQRPADRGIIILRNWRNDYQDLRWTQ